MTALPRIERSVKSALASVIGLERPVPSASSTTLEESRATVLAAQLPEVLECHHVTGDHDYLLMVACRNPLHIDQFLNESIEQNGDVAKTRTLIVLGSPKESLFVPPDVGAQRYLTVADSERRTSNNDTRRVQMFAKPTMRTLITAAAVVILSGSSTACMATVRPRDGVVYVREAPPRAIREARPLSPGRSYVWVPGHYDYRGRAYVWVPGRYELPIASNYRRWEPGRWRHDRNGWYWIEGQWR